MNILETAKRVFSVEKDALEGISKRLDSNFEEAAKRLYACSGRIVVCGMGKSGLIGKKIAATFASIGQPSIFMHPSEAIHGDLGMLMRFLPERYWPVSDCDDFLICAGVPSATTMPPCTPAPGPMSTT